MEIFTHNQTSNTTHNGERASKSKGDASYRTMAGTEASGYKRWALDREGKSKGKVVPVLN
jgi:hypothetical protein